jgi:hypothetical protein
MVGIVLFGWSKGRGQINLVDKLLLRGPKTLRRRLLNRLAADGRNETRKNITSQGRGTWAKLSKWTAAQTGRRKALITLRRFVGVKKANSKAMSAATVFRSPGDFTLTQHHTGFTELAKGGVVKIPLKRPGALDKKGKLNTKGAKEVSFKDTTAKVVPARPVWPDRKQLKPIIRKNILLFVKDLQKALARKAAKRRG